MKDNTCFNCTYIADELERRMAWYDTDREFYESYEGMYCWCDKVGGKISMYGTCSEGSVAYEEPNYSISIENNGRGRLYRRLQRKRHIKHKKNICHHQTMHPTFINEYGRNRADLSREVPMEWYEHDGQYDKGKVHCGCKLCKPYKGYYPSGKDERLRNIARDKMRDWERELKEAI